MDLEMDRSTCIDCFHVPVHSFRVRRLPVISERRVGRGSKPTSRYFLGWDWWPELQEHLAASVSEDVEVVKVNCGHRVQVEQPDKVIDAVRRLLARIENRVGQ